MTLASFSRYKPFLETGEESGLRRRPGFPQKAGSACQNVPASEHWAKKLLIQLVKIKTLIHGAA